MYKKQIEEILLYIKNDPIKVWDLYQRISEDLKYLILKLAKEQYFKWCSQPKYKASEEKYKVFSIFCLFMEFTKTQAEMFKMLEMAEYQKRVEN